MTTQETEKPRLRLVIRRPITQQGNERFSIQHIKTHETGFVAWGWGRSCLMSNGHMVIWGKTAKEASPEIFVFDSNGVKIKTIKAFCSHERINLLPLVIESTEYMAMSCSRCRDINLYHMRLGTVTNAFVTDFPGPTCHGPDGSLFVVHCVDTSPIYKLDWRQMQFRLGEKTETHVTKPEKETDEKTIGMLGICHIPNTDILVMSSPKNNARIWAVSCTKDKLLWEINDSKNVPHCVVYSHKYHVLIVADGTNSRLFILNPESGEHIQTIDISWHAASAWVPYIYKDQLIIHHQGWNEYEQVSYYKLTSRQEVSPPDGYMETLCTGSPITLYSPDSDVSVEVPEKTMHGTIAAEIFTKTRMFRHLIPAKECLISPIVSFRTKSVEAQVIRAGEKRFVMRIPHAVPEISKAQDKIRVRHGDIRRASQLLTRVWKTDESQDQDVSFTIDDKFIRIESKFLTGFVVTLSGPSYNTLETSIRVYASMKRSGERGFAVELKSFLCNPLFSIKDYQKLIEKRAGPGMKCVKVHPVQVEKDTTVRPIEMILCSGDESSTKPAKESRVLTRDRELAELATFSTTSDTAKFQADLTAVFKLKYHGPMRPKEKKQKKKETGTCCCWKRSKSDKRDLIIEKYGELSPGESIKEYQLQIEIDSTL